LRTLQTTLGSTTGHGSFTVLAFPCNQFGGQEPGSEAEILEFATSRYQVNFPMFAKVEVNGAGACDLYQWLKKERPDDTGKQDIAWNFTKFLVDGDGLVIARYAPTTTPETIGHGLASKLNKS
jgi:glutathione peroxidase